MAKKAVGNYQKVQVNTASPGQRVVMVYNAIARNLKTAIDAFDESSPSKFEVINNSILSAEKLITELQIALDKVNGGEIAENLDALYVFWHQHLSDANSEKDKKKLKDILSMVEELVESWSDAEKKARTGQ